MCIKKMNYDTFDMKQLLNAFDGDPEKLANAFADALNNELAEQRKINAVDTAAQDVANAWEDFIDEYFAVHAMPDGVTQEDFYIEPDHVITAMELLIKAVPYFSLLGEYLGKLEELSNICEEKIADTKENINAVATDAYADIMNRFFKKNNI